jgi:DnaK suppressor protein
MLKKELEYYKKRLLEEKEKMFSDVHKLEDISLHETEHEGSGNLSSYVTHPADIATDNYEQEKNLDFMDNIELLLEEVENALKKIDDKTYGKCEQCRKPIDTKRLKAEPYARLCMNCKKAEECNERK